MDAGSGRSRTEEHPVAGSAEPNQKAPAARPSRRAFWRDPRYAILALLVVAVIILGAAKRRELSELGREIQRLNLTTVSLALACQLGKFVAVALTFHLLLRVLNYRIPIPYLFASGLAMVFFNQAVPSMGTSGNAYMYTALQRRGVSSGSAVIVTILNMLTYYIAFFLLAVSTMIYLALAHALEGEHVVGMVVFFAMMITLFVWIRFRTQRRERFERTIADINRIVGRLTRGSVDGAIPDHFVDDFFDGRSLIIGAKKRFILPVVTNFAMFLADAGTLYVVFHSLGHPVLYRYVVASYVVGLILYAFAIIPGALGVYEAALTAMLSAFRVPTTAALAGVILFRGFSFWLPIPIGFAIYSIAAHRRRAEAPSPQPAAQPAHSENQGQPGGAP
jgi:uncharacterized protein (TIRG00374 family)